MIGIEKYERYWNIGFILFSILLVGYLFDFKYLTTISPSLELFSIITNPLAAIFYLGGCLIAFRHSYLLMRFIAQKTPQLSMIFMLVFILIIAACTLLIYVSFGFDQNQLTYPFEWNMMVFLEFIVLFWLLLIQLEWLRAFMAYRHKN